MLTYLEMLDVLAVGTEDDRVKLARYNWKFTNGRCSFRHENTIYQKLPDDVILALAQDESLKVRYTIAASEELPDNAILVLWKNNDTVARLIDYCDNPLVRHLDLIHQRSIQT